MTITFSSPSNFDWMFLVNAIIAAIAVAGFILSWIYSSKNLKQANDLIESQNKTHLFEYKCDLLEHFYEVVNKKDWLTSLTDYNITLKLNRLELAFNNTSELSKLISDIREYVKNDAAFPIVPSVYSNHFDNDAALMFHYLRLLDTLSEQIKPILIKE